MIPLISVVYVNYNSSKLLISSVESLRAQCASVSFEIIIVDNNSNEVQQAILKQWISGTASEKIKLVSSEINKGFAAANNIGAEMALGKYLFFLNPDTLILNNVLEIFVDFMEASSSTTVACGGNLLNEDLSPNNTYGNFPGLLLEMCNVGLGLSTLLNRYYTKNIAISCTLTGEGNLMVPYIVGAAFFVRTREFKSLGGFDEKFFMYYEETDLFLRFKKQNLHSYILPQAKIIHYEGASVGNDKLTFNYGKFEMLLNSKLYYYSKWKPDFRRLLKTLILMQISVQYLKGNWGNDFGKLVSIYSRCNKFSKLD